METLEELAYWDELCLRCTTVKNTDCPGIRPVLDEESTKLYGQPWTVLTPCARRKVSDNQLRLARGFVKSGLTIDSDIHLTTYGEHIVSELCDAVTRKDFFYLYPVGTNIIDIHRVMQLATYRLFVNLHRDADYVVLPQFWRMPDADDISMFRWTSRGVFLADYDVGYPPAKHLADLMSWLCVRLDQNQSVVMCLSQDINDLNLRNTYDRQIQGILQQCFQPMVIRQNLLCQK